MSSFLIRRSASGLPPVWQVGQYCRLESANDTSRTVSPQTGQAPQSSGHEPQFSPCEQVPSPHWTAGQQSVWQPWQLSPTSHRLLPQTGPAQQSPGHEAHDSPGAQTLSPQAAGQQSLGQVEQVAVPLVRHHQPEVGVENGEPLGDVVERLEHGGLGGLDGVHDPVPVFLRSPF